MLPICILAIRDDDDRAYMTRLYVKYQRLMYRTIYDILGDKWATEDVLQTTLLRLIDHLDTLRRLELDALAQVWPRLDENTRWLLEARYILDYSDGELARELGVKPDSVRMALTRARRKARRLMENQHSKENV